MNKARDGEFKIHIATVAIAEVYKAKHSGLASGDALDDFMSLLDEDIMEPIEVDRSTAIAAHILCRQHLGILRPFDALHLACAAAARCDYLLSWDGPLGKVSHPSVLISEPKIYDRNLITELEAATAEKQTQWYRENPRRRDQIGTDLAMCGTFSNGTGI